MRWWKVQPAGLVSIACAACCLVPGLIAAGPLAGGGVTGAALGWLPGIAVALVALVFLIPVLTRRTHDCGNAAEFACACSSASAQTGSVERRTLRP